MKNVLTWVLLGLGQISMSLIASFLKGMGKRLAVDDHNDKHLSDRPCAYNLIEEALYMWIVSNVIQRKKHNSLGPFSCEKESFP